MYIVKLFLFTHWNDTCICIHVAFGWPRLMQTLPSFDQPEEHPVNGVETRNCPMTAFSRYISQVFFFLFHLLRPFILLIDLSL